ncbi:BA14K family protein [Microvirga flavescens]|uniref:BA14K family protein n=1 Tax=Microvirga flavescens TaxID=2249811 RepID=UPI000DDB4742|nr:BA14K family protein [Microvirga flavescens]
MRKIVLALAGVSALVMAMPAAAETVSRDGRSVDLSQPYPNEGYTQYYYRRGYYYGPYYGPRYYRRYDDGSAALAAGAAGLAAGALIGGAIASQPSQSALPAPPGTVSPSVAAYCARKYRSYDPATGTYLATNGMRYVCTP